MHRGGKGSNLRHPVFADGSPPVRRGQRALAQLLRLRAIGQAQLASCVEAGATDGIPRLLDKVRGTLATVTH